MLALHSRAAAFARAFIAFGLAAGVTACGGGSSSSGTSPVPNYGFCGNDTSYALARPQSGGTITAGQTIEIVASGNTNQIYQSYQNFDLILVPANNSGNAVTGSLATASDPSGYKPFSSDFYYSGTLQTGLIPGQQYNVYVNSYTSNCTPVGPIGQLFS